MSFLQSRKQIALSLCRHFFPPHGKKGSSKKVKEVRFVRHCARLSSNIKLKRIGVYSLNLP